MLFDITDLLDYLYKKFKVNVVLFNINVSVIELFNFSHF